MGLQNKCLFVGNLGKDPELQFTPNGVEMSRFSLAVDKLKKGESGYERGTVWVNLTVFGKTAKNFCDIAKKGATIMVDAEYDSSIVEVDGQRNYYHSFVVRDWRIVKWPKRNGEVVETTEEGISGYKAARLDDDDIPF